MPIQLNTAAIRIAIVVATERPVTAPFLQGVAHEVTSRTLTDLKRQDQSSMAQVANLSGNQGVPFHAQAPSQHQAQEYQAQG